MAVVHSDNWWLSQISTLLSAKSFDSLVSKTITFDGTDGAGKILTKATATVTASSIADGDTVTIGGQTYTFQTVLVDAANNVLIGVSDATALDNLKLAINAGAGAGTNYGTGTVANASVTATTNTDTTQVVEALTAGTAGNSIAVTSSGATLTWDNPTLTGGSDGTVPLFTVTGDVWVDNIVATCSSDLVGATATISVGTANNTVGLLGSQTATNASNGDVWNGGGFSAEVASGWGGSGDQNIWSVVAGGADIIATIGTADITAGVLTFYIAWHPLSSGATLVAA